MYRLPMHFIAWKQLVYSRAYERLLEENAYSANNLLLIGHPKFDIKENDFTAEEKRVFNIIRKNAKNRKIFMWNTHFAIDKRDQEGAGTFLYYGLEFIKYVLKRNDIYLIWRPHPLFLETIKRADMDMQAEEIFDLVEKSENLYFDIGKSQWPAVFASDVLISDASGVVESYMITRKPIILTLRENQQNMLNDVVYRAADFKELCKMSNIYWQEKTYFVRPEKSI